MLTSSDLAKAADNAFEKACRAVFTVFFKERLDPTEPAHTAWFRGHTWFSPTQEISRGVDNFEIGQVSFTIEVHDEAHILFFRPADGDFPDFLTDPYGEFSMAGRLESLLSWVHRAPRELVPVVTEDSLKTDLGFEAINSVEASHTVIEDFHFEDNPTGEHGPIDIAMVKTIHDVWIDRNEVLRRVGSRVFYETPERRFRANAVSIDLVPAGRELAIRSILEEPLRTGDYDLQTYYCEKMGLEDDEIDFGLAPPTLGLN